MRFILTAAIEKRLKNGRLLTNDGEGPGTAVVSTGCRPLCKAMNDFLFYFKIGWTHIINPEALDHILFIVALAAIYTLRDWKQVLILVTAFTLGHTITLVLSTKQWVNVSSNLVEFLIPCTIIITAISNLFQKTFTTRSIGINYFLALFFGLVHGLAFANTLRMILASDQSFAFSMFSFSVGLELGQIGIVLVILLLSYLCLRILKIERRHWVIFLSAAVFALALEMAVQRLPAAFEPSPIEDTQPHGPHFPRKAR